MVWRRVVVFGVALAAGAALAAWGAPEAWAKPKKESLSGKFGKKGFKSNMPPSMLASWVGALQGLTLTANYAKIGIGKGKFAWVTFSVGNCPDPRTATFPVTLTGGAGTYAYTAISGFGVPNPSDAPAWATNNGMTIVLTGYDAASQRVSGTFSGTMDPGENNPGAGPIAVTKGKFNVDLLAN